jgi:hypothetical protein
MTKFTGCKGNCYTYDNNGTEHAISQSLLNGLFNAYGYCVDPASTSEAALSPESIESLRKVAAVNGDNALIKTIDSIPQQAPCASKCKVDKDKTQPSQHCAFDKLTPCAKKRVKILLDLLIKIGMYLGGWLGPQEPYITKFRPIKDMVRIDQRIYPLIKQLLADPDYSVIKNYVIIQYDKDLKPIVVDKKYTIGMCIDEVNLGTIVDREHTARLLISTGCYYITSLYHDTLTTVQPLLKSMV